jgi:catechol 2,3-dioxygenase-like lactoylglutathione lyase family enzyme
MLASETLVAFLGTAKPEAARAFYEGVLGLTFSVEDEFIMAFEAGSARINFQKSQTPVVPPHGTAIGWNVAALRDTIRALAARGVVFERFDGMTQDELGVWSPHPGTGVAWFKDPDGNLLSVSGEL